MPIPGHYAELYLPRTDKRKGFNNEYQSKVYQYPLTEQTSVSLEFLITNPVELLNRDPGVIELVISFL